MPVRITPLGAPLLIASVVDRRLSEKLIAQLKLEAEQRKADFTRIICEGGEKPVATLEAPMHLH